MLRLRIRVDLEVMAIKKYSTILRSPVLELYHQMNFGFIPRNLIFRGRVLLLYWGYSQRILSHTDRVVCSQNLSWEMLFTNLFRFWEKISTTGHNTRLGYMKENFFFKLWNSSFQLSSEWNYSKGINEMNSRNLPEKKCVTWN